MRVGCLLQDWSVQRIALLVFLFVLFLLFGLLSFSKKESFSVVQKMAGSWEGCVRFECPRGKLVIRQSSCLLAFLPLLLA